MPQVREQPLPYPAFAPKHNPRDLETLLYLHCFPLTFPYSSVLYRAVFLPLRSSPRPATQAPTPPFLTVTTPPFGTLHTPFAENFEGRTPRERTG